MVRIVSTTIDGSVSNQIDWMVTERIIPSLEYRKWSFSSRDSTISKPIELLSTAQDYELDVTECIAFNKAKQPAPPVLDKQ